jgi:hypothetical protein
MIAAVDPGTIGAGLAIISDVGVPVFVEQYNARRALPVWERCMFLVDQIAGDLSERQGTIERCIIEIPDGPFPSQGAMRHQTFVSLGMMTGALRYAIADNLFETIGIPARMWTRGIGKDRRQRDTAVEYGGQCGVVLDDTRARPDALTALALAAWWQREVRARGVAGVLERAAAPPKRASSRSAR